MNRDYRKWRSRVLVLVAALGLVGLGIHASLASPPPSLWTEHPILR